MKELSGKILLATDGSEDAAVATLAAIDIANRSGSELHVVHAFEFVPPREYISVALRVHSPFTSQRHGRHLLEEQAELIVEAGGEIAETHLCIGSPVDQILCVAEELDAGLIVMGSRGLGGVKRILMGSVSEGVIHHARCPVLVVRPGNEPWPPSRVMIADDFSENARMAGDLAANIGGLLGAEAELVQVYPRLLETSREKGSEESRVIEEVLQSAEAKLRERAANLEGALGRRPEAKLVVDEGTDGIDGIAMTLLDVAQETGEPTLIALGSRGLGAMQRARVGSVSTKVVRAHPGPVLIYPRDATPVTRETGEPVHEERSCSDRRAENTEGGVVAR
ncbi:MAG: Universal stress protein family [uncultured Rubrobacteraceae bacterium]|uniref:Universal stress protein family n=1 Tax=uncultured Rubrobacteraceae bacterium TaxID=349277 RepID=A0A6J4R0E6_9ACTN|nr:MAG: Universal stress protein family [uncultured Rubrobacteraceae bacterium]